MFRVISKSKGASRTTRPIPLFCLEIQVPSPPPKWNILSDGSSYLIIPLFRRLKTCPRREIDNVRRERQWLKIRYVHIHLCSIPIPLLLTPIHSIFKGLSCVPTFFKRKVVNSHPLRMFFILYKNFRVYYKDFHFFMLYIFLKWLNRIIVYIL